MMKLDSSYITINGLRFHAYHGVLPQERLTGNDYLINLRVKYSIEKAMHTDCVEATLNYASVYEVIASEMKTPSNLLEHVAGRIGAHLFDMFPEIKDIDLSISKLNPPMGADCMGAGVEVHLINDKN
jgi:dihydroneopterin aldolase